MTVYYIDWEGAAGTGDGTSFANRAKRMFDLGSSTVNPGDEIRIKKSPDPTSLGTGKVKKTHCQPYYYQRSIGASNVTWSTTEGETYITTSSSSAQGFETGDVIHFWKSTAAAGKNLNGLRVVTVTDSHESDGTIKIDNFTASNTDAEGGNLNFGPCSASTIVLNTDNITKSIACRDPNRTAWTASSNVTCTANVMSSGDWNNNEVDWQIGTGCDKIEITSSASAGKSAYWELPSTLDLSGYQQISFIVRNSIGQSATAHHSIRLCTDTAGETSVHTIPIQTNDAPTSYWTPVVVDLGTNLNASIKSIAIYTDTTGMSRSYMIQNIIACKASSSADSLTHRSLVGLNTTNDPVWYPVAAIWDNIIFLRTWNGKVGPYGYYSSVTGYFSASNDSATIYKREPIDNPNMGTQYWETADRLQESGTSSDWITISGGWDDTNMSTKNGKTFARSNGGGYGLYMLSNNYQDVSNIYLNGYFYAFYCGSSTNAISQCGYSDIWEYGTQWTGTAYKLGFDYAFGVKGKTIDWDDITQHSSANVSDFYFKWIQGGWNREAFRAYDQHDWHWDYINCHGHNQRGFYVHNSSNWKCNTMIAGYSFDSYAGIVGGTTSAEFTNLTVTDTSMGLYMSGGTATVGTFTQNAIKNIPGNTSYGRRYGLNLGANGSVQLSDGVTLTILGGTIDRKFYVYGGTIKSKNLTIDDTVDAYFTSAQGKVLMKDYDGTSGAYKNVFPTGEINPETSIRHTASGFAWKFIHSSASSTVSHAVGSVVVNASSLVTIGVWVYVTNVSNKTAKLILKSNTELGMSGDVTADSSSGVSNNTWTKLEATFTPNAAGIVEVELHSVSTSSTTDYVYFDDMEVAQA